MPFPIPSVPAPAPVRLAPVEPRLAPFFALVLLAASCALASLALACATPFAAFAVIAAAMLPLPAALLMVAAAWIVNQAIGFAALGYPHEIHTVLWGVIIGAAALAATAAGKLVLRLLPRPANAVAFALALLGAYAAYELVLFAATPILGGAGAFTPSIVGRLGLVNGLWLIGLAIACEIVRLVADSRRRQMLA